jgi:hypothetical protein
MLIILGLTVIGIFYLTQISMVIYNDKRDFAQNHILDTLSHIDFGRFWYVGQRLLQAIGYRFAEPPSLLNLQFPMDTISKTHIAKLTWPYPPPMALVYMFFALFSLQKSFWVWSAATLVCGACLMRKAGLTWSAIVIGLLSPAEFYNFSDGQNGAFFGSLQVTCLLMLEAYPRSAGMIAGWFICKPQLGLSLLAILPQRWRPVMPWAVLSAVVLAICSLLFEGIEMWRFFFTIASSTTANFLTQNFVNRYPIWSISVYFMVRSFGGSVVIAAVLQVVFAVIALILISAAWRAPSGPRLQRVAFTLCLAPLITPYEFITDLTGFAVIMAAMFLISDDYKKLIYGFLWLMTGASIYLCIFTGHVLFPLFAVIGAIACHPFKSSGSPNRRFRRLSTISLSLK